MMAPTGEYGKNWMPTKSRKAGASYRNVTTSALEYWVTTYLQPQSKSPAGVAVQILATVANLCVFRKRMVHRTVACYVPSLRR